MFGSTVEQPSHGSPVVDGSVEEATKMKGLWQQYTQLILWWAGSRGVGLEVGIGQRWRVVGAYHVIASSRVN